MALSFSEMRHFYETKSAHSRARFFVSFIAGARDGVAGGEFLFFGGGGDPGGDGTGLFDGVAFFVAIVFAVGEGVILGRDAVGELEVAVGLLGRVDGALEFAEQLVVAGQHGGDGLAVADANEDLLDESGAIEALAGFLPLLAVMLLKSGGGAGDSEFGLHLLFPGALESVEVLEDACQGALGGGFVAVEESEFMEGFGRPGGGIGLRGVESGFDRVESALAAPEEPAGERGVFDKIARVGSFGRILFEHFFQQCVEIFLALAGNDEFFRGAAVRQRVAAGDFLAGVRDRPGLWMEVAHTYASVGHSACGRRCVSHVSC